MKKSIKIKFIATLVMVVMIAMLLLGSTNVVKASNFSKATNEFEFNSSELLRTIC